MDNEEISDVVKICKEEDFVYQFKEIGDIVICKAEASGKPVECEHRDSATIEIDKVNYHICNAVKQYTPL